MAQTVQMKDACSAPFVSEQINQYPLLRKLFTHRHLRSAEHHFQQMQLCIGT